MANKPPKVMGGMAGNADDAIRLRKPYMQYSESEMENGRTPKPFDEWLMEMKSVEKEMSDGFDSVKKKR